MCSPSLVSSIHSCFVHHLVWITSSVSSINSCFAHHLVLKVLPRFDTSTVVSYIILHGFLQFFIPSAVVCTWSDLGSPSLVSSINSYLVHHLEWYSLSVSSINSCFVLNLVRVVLHWCHPSTVVSCIIWFGFLHLPRSSTFALYIIQYGKSFIGLIHQQLVCTSSVMDSFSSLIHQ